MDQPVDFYTERQYVLQEAVMRDTAAVKEEEQAIFQPAVTLMTPFVTACGLTSWQWHAAPDGGEGHSAIPFLRSSLIVGQQECRKESEGVEATSAHSLTDGALAQFCKTDLVLGSLTAGGLILWPDLSVSKTETYEAGGPSVQPLFVFRTSPIETLTQICLIRDSKSQGASARI